MLCCNSESNCDAENKNPLPAYTESMQKRDNMLSNLIVFILDAPLNTVLGVYYLNANLFEFVSYEV